MWFDVVRMNFISAKYVSCLMKVRYGAGDRGRMYLIIKVTRVCCY